MEKGVLMMRKTDVLVRLGLVVLVFIGSVSLVRSSSEVEDESQTWAQVYEVEQADGDHIRKPDTYALGLVIPEEV